MCELCMLYCLRARRVLYETHEFSGGPDRKKRKITKHMYIKMQRKTPNTNVLTAVAYAHENTIMTTMEEGAKKETNKLKWDASISVH